MTEKPKADGAHWSAWTRLAAIQEGQSEISAIGADVAGAVFNYHPQGKGLNWRTNLYYIETRDWGTTWHTVEGDDLSLPLNTAQNGALVHDYASEGLNVYLKDIRYDAAKRPVILYLTSRGYEAGPGNDPRTWTIARWTGLGWEVNTAFTSDSNYDMWSLYLEGDIWRVIAPTAPGPQRFNPGGEVVVWVSDDQGRRWEKVRQLTEDSPYNHTYVRRPLQAHPNFYAFWADGHARRPSGSNLYFCDRAGDVYRLPRRMEGDSIAPEPVV
jgi:hypothetical protein